jgi:hypothetical protein
LKIADNRFAFALKYGWIQDFRQRSIVEFQRRGSIAIACVKAFVARYAIQVSMTNPFLPQYKFQVVRLAGRTLFSHCSHRIYGVLLKGAIVVETINYSCAVDFDQVK